MDENAFVVVGRTLRSEHMIMIEAVVGHAQKWALWIPAGGHEINHCMLTVKGQGAWVAWPFLITINGFGSKDLGIGCSQLQLLWPAD